VWKGVWLPAVGIEEARANDAAAEARALPAVEDVIKEEVNSNTLWLEAVFGIEL
jgi:hypothetical protein